MKTKLSKKAVDEFREIMKKECGEELAEDEAREMALLILSLYKICANHRYAYRKLEERLKNHPEGYRIGDDEAICQICNNVQFGATMWFDKWGPKCEPCYRMVRRHALPASVCLDRDSWYSESDLQITLGLTRREINRMIRVGKLKPRIVKGTGFAVFIISENEILNSLK